MRIFSESQNLLELLLTAVIRTSLQYYFLCTKCDQSIEDVVSFLTEVHLNIGSYVQQRYQSFEAQPTSREGISE
jgi:hypothetical protein